MIREATLDDVTEIVAMLLSDQFWSHVESFKNIPINIVKGKAFITKLISDDDGMVYVAIHHDKIVGVVIGEIITSWCSDEKHSTDYALYVHSRYRHLRYGYSLLKTFTNETLKKGINKYITGLPFCDFNVSSMDKLLNRMGFNKTATIYEKDLI